MTVARTTPIQPDHSSDQLQLQMQISGVNFAVGSVQSPIDDRFETMWNDLFASVEAVVSTPPVTVQVMAVADAADAITPPDSSKLLVQTDVTSVWRSDTEFWLRTQGVTASVSKKSVQLAVDEAYWQKTLFEQRDFMLVTMVAALRLNGVYAFHGNGLVRNGTGIIVTGSSGAGKTTLTHALVEHGWKYLSDDAIALKTVNGETQAWALRKGFSLTTNALERAGVESVWDKNSLRTLGNGKYLAGPSPATLSQFTPHCAPSAIFFTSVGSSEHTVVERIQPAQALILALEQAAGLLTDIASTSAQLNVLRDLVQQSACYRLIAGKDVIATDDGPERVSNLIFDSTNVSL